ncbi:MAG: hypothetical protein L0Y72_25560 [Gemmataceae bacterium]|nr:hypothetical protein [Gemmataceae bacterium]MCI0742414.1 hypothetical protein [Gemmataceae bacterium]
MKKPAANEKVVIKISAKDHDKARGFLARNWPGIALKDRVFIVSVEAARALKTARISYEIIAWVGDLDRPISKISGKRI